MNVPKSVNCASYPVLRTNGFYLITVAQFNWLLVNGCSSKCEFCVEMKRYKLLQKAVFCLVCSLSETLSLLKPPRWLSTAAILQLKVLAGQDVSHVVPWLLGLKHRSLGSHRLMRHLSH